MSNQALLRKADMALSELTSAGGRLSTEQSFNFIRTVIEQPTLLREARVVAMGGPVREINKIGFGSRILKAATENTALSSGNRSKPTTSKITLTSKEVIAEVRLPYAVIEDNIERGNVNFGNPKATGGIVDTLVQLIAERCATDLEELALLGDTASGDSYLALLDGWLKLADDHDNDAASAAISRTVLKNALLQLPSKYLRDRTAMRHYLSTKNEIEYADQLAGRETALGDAKHNEAAPVYAAGIRVSGISQMPDASGLLTVPNNLIFGIQRDISFEADKDISARQYIIVVTARIDAKIEETDAVVRTINLG